MKTFRLIAPAAILAALLAALAVGCGSRFTHLVMIGPLSIVKSDGFSSEGGAVTITCEVTSKYAITEAHAGIQRTGTLGGLPAMTPMTLTTGSTYSVTLPVPPNSRSDGQPENYDVYVRGHDAADYYTTEGLKPAFSVPGRI